MELSVENICGLLIRSRLLTPDEVKAMYQRWQAEAKAAAGSVAQFGKWLVAQQYVTAYQAALLARGHAGGFFLNQYRILDRVGKGRMAGVYRARHALGPVVAIKVLPPSKVRDPQAFARFLRESRLALRLRHPNVVRTFQVGQAGDLHYHVMEYLDGETLEDVLLRRGRLPPAEAVRIVSQALHGLQHIHEQGLVHRDLKPANLMLVPGARGGGSPDTTLSATVKVLDIGLGRELFDEQAAGDVSDYQLTGEGVLLGTPDYLAPEQARDALRSDVRADIYSLGCVLYRLLTGQPPFTDTNIITLLVRHATEPPRPVKELNPAVPDGLQQILDRMLAKEPADRYQTPERAAAALQPWLAAGAEPARAADSDPSLRAYLTWLETDGAAGAPPAAIPVSAGPVTKAAMPLGRPLPPPGVPRARKRKKRRKTLIARPAPEVDPTPAPAGVELVPLPAEAGPAPAVSRLRLSPRDWLLIAIGAGGVIAAGLLGMVLGSR